jgi:phosphoglycerol transferase MdoB-like AlkP superfamily enzyme
MGARPARPFRCGDVVIIFFRKLGLTRLEWLLEMIGLVAALTGASLVAIFGKLMLAFILLMLALGIYWRMSGRERKVKQALEQERR